MVGPGRSRPALKEQGANGLEPFRLIPHAKRLAPRFRGSVRMAAAPSYPHMLVEGGAGKCCPKWGAIAAVWPDTVVGKGRLA